jgi:hypothetical protein
VTKNHVIESDRANSGKFTRLPRPYAVSKKLVSCTNLILSARIRPKSSITR